MGDLDKDGRLIMKLNLVTCMRSVEGIMAAKEEKMVDVC